MNRKRDQHITRPAGLGRERPFSRRRRRSERDRIARPGIRPWVAMAVAAAAVWGAATPVRCGESPLAIRAAAVYIGDGRRVENGVVLIQAGRIQAVGPEVPVPEGAAVIAVPEGCVTPGLIDANARIATAELIPPARGTGRAGDGGNTARGTRTMAGGPVASGQSPGADRSADPGDPSGPGEPPGMVGEVEDLPTISGVRPAAVINDQGSEVIPHLRVLDGLDFRVSDFRRLARGGVTTVYASADASAVIGARGAVLHTAGPPADRVLVPAAAVKATIGSEPSYLGAYNRRPSRYSVSIYWRRPNSRMGLVWVFRKAFYDALRRRDGLPVYGADTAEPEAHAVLLEVLDGKVPLRIQARIQQDILAALRLAEEFDLKFTLEEGTEAYRCLAELKAAGVPVIYGPIYDAPSGLRARAGFEARRFRYYTFRALLEAGIPTALSAQEFRDEDGLARLAMYAQRFGVPFGEALRSVTQTPARLLGLEDQLGTVEAGKRADLVVWNGQPFAPTSMPQLILIDGEIVVDRR